VAGLVADLTELVGAPVVGPDGARIGRLVDLAADADDPHPVVTGLVVRSGGGRLAIRAADVAGWNAAAIVLLAGYRSIDTELGLGAALLTRDVLDTQIVDVGGRRVTRVADVMLAERDGRLRVTGVDVGAGAVLRRLGLRRIGARMGERRLPWDELHPLHDRARSLVVDPSPEPPPHRRPLRYPRLGRRLRARS
jgi:sporulation protein YlmC with PRC-barrel domain